jgi:hypothetical protein
MIQLLKAIAAGHGPVQKCFSQRFVTPDDGSRLGSFTNSKRVLQSTTNIDGSAPIEVGRRNIRRRVWSPTTSHLGVPDDEERRLRRHASSTRPSDWRRPSPDTTASRGYPRGRSRAVAEEVIARTTARPRLPRKRPPPRSQPGVAGARRTTPWGRGLPSPSPRYALSALIPIERPGDAPPAGGRCADTIGLIPDRTVSRSPR